jgi:hypothetical protein
VRNLISHSKRRRSAGDVREQIAEECISVTVGGGRSEEDCIMRSYVLSILISRYYSGDEIKENGMGGVCGTSGEQEK